MPGLNLGRSANGKQVLVAIVGPVQIVAVLFIPEIELDAGCRKGFVIAGGGLSIELANRDFHLYLLTKVAPIHQAVVEALKNERVSILDAVRECFPLVRVVRAVE